MEDEMESGIISGTSPILMRNFGPSRQGHLLFRLPHRHANVEQALW